MIFRNMEKVMVYDGEFEMLECLWNMVEKWIKRFRGGSILEWLYYIYLEDLLGGYVFIEYKESLLKI